MSREQELYLGVRVDSGELGAAGRHAYELALDARARLRQLLAALVANLLGEVQVLALLLVLVQRLRSSPDISHNAIEGPSQHRWHNLAHTNPQASQSNL